MASIWMFVLISLHSVLIHSISAAIVGRSFDSPLSIVVKRQADNGVSEPEVSTAVAPTDESLLDLFSTSSKEKRPPRAIIQSMHAVSNITFRYAKTRIENKVLNPAQVAQEVFFNVIIPETAFISGFSMEIDGKVYDAYVKEKQEAQKVYDAAIKQGVTAGHVKQSARDSNRFSVSVNVEPQKKVRFNLTYEELLERRYGSYRHVINLNPGQLVEDLQVDIFVNENRNITRFRVPEFQSANEVYPVLDGKDFDLAATERISPTEVKVSFRPTVDDQKKLRKKVNDHTETGETKKGEDSEGMSGQFAIEYDVERDPEGGEVLVNDGYFVHFFAPLDLPPLRKHIVFVLDVSGSMDGRKIEQLKQAMDGILSELNPNDFFNIIEFAFSVTVRDLDSPALTAEDNPWLHQLSSSSRNSTTKKVKPFPASPDYIQKGKEVVKKMTAAGGTNIHDALSVAIEIAKTSMNEGIVKRSATEEDTKFKAPEPMIIFLTDGEPTVGITSDSNIIKHVDESNEEPRIPIFSLAFGTDADFTLLKRISLLTNGFARQIYEAADTSLQLRNFYKEISSPVLSKVKFVYPPEQVQNETITKVNFANFFGGAELVVSGKLKDEKVTGNIGHVEASSAEGVHNYSVNHIDYSPPLLKTERNYRPLERLWVYMTIKQLLNEAELMKARSYLVEYNKEETDPLELKPEEKALRLALEYSFVCPLTSLVVVKPGSLTDANVEPAAANPAPALFVRSSVLSSVLPLRFGAPSSIEGSAFASKVQAQGFGAQPPGLNVMLMGHADNIGSIFPSTTAGVPIDNSPTSAAASHGVHSDVLTDRAHFSLESIAWLPQLLTGDVLHLPGGDNSTDYVLARNQTDEAYGNCTVSSTGKSGECRHLEHCVLSDIVNDVQIYYTNFFCVIPGNYAGICCPVDDPVSEQPTAG